MMSQEKEAKGILDVYRELYNRSFDRTALLLWQLVYIMDQVNQGLDEYLEPKKVTEGDSWYLHAHDLLEYRSIAKIKSVTVEELLATAATSPFLQVDPHEMRLSVRSGVERPPQPRVQLDDRDFQYMLTVLRRHPEAASKIGQGVDSIYVARKGADLCFYVQRLDGQEEDFSYRNCFKSDRRYCADMVWKAFREAPSDDIARFREMKESAFFRPEAFMRPLVEEEGEQD